MSDYLACLHMIVQAAGVLKPRRGGGRGEGLQGDLQATSSGRQQQGGGPTADGMAEQGSKRQSRDAQLRSLGGSVGDSDGSIDDLWALHMGDADEEGGKAAGQLPSEPAQKRQWGSGLMKKYSPQEYRRVFPNRGGE